MPDLKNYPLSVTLALVDKLTTPFQDAVGRMLGGKNRLQAIGRDVNRWVLDPLKQLTMQSLEAGTNYARTLNAIEANSSTTQAAVHARLADVEAAGRKTLAGTQAAAEGVESLTHRGRSLDEALQLLVPSLELANVAETGVADSTRLLDNVLDTFGAKAADGAHVADLLARGALVAGTTIPELAEGLKQVAPLARALHIPFDQVLAQLLALAPEFGGVGGAATGLSSAYQILAKEGYAAADGALDVSHALDVLHDRGLAADDAVERFGRRSKGLGTLMRLGADGIRASGDALARVNSLERQHEIRNQGLVGTEKDLQNVWTDTLRTIGSTENLEALDRILKDLTPTIEAAAKGIGYLGQGYAFLLEGAESAGTALGNWWIPGPPGTRAVRRPRGAAGGAKPAAAPAGGPRDVSDVERSEFPKLPGAKAQVDITLKGFPAGTRVEKKGDVGVTTDLGLGIPGAGAGH